MKDIDNILEAVQSGQMDPVVAWDTISAIEAACNKAKQIIKPIAVDELAKHGKEGLRIGDVRYTVRASAGRWKFDHIQRWNEMKEQAKEVEEQAKAAYQATAKGLGGLHTWDGEVIEPAVYVAGADTIYTEKAKP